MFRTVTKTGPASLTITLPANWAREFKIEQGSQVRVDQIDNSLRISPSLEQVTSPITIKYNPLLIENMLTKLHAEHNTQITIESDESLPASLPELVKSYPGLTIIDQKPLKIVVQRTSISTGSQSKAILRRCLRLMEHSFNTNPPTIESDIQQLLFILKLEQYRPGIVANLQEITESLTNDAPYYDNAYAYFSKLFSLLARQFFSFTIDGAYQIIDLLKKRDAVAESGFRRTTKPVHLSKLLIAINSLSEINDALVREQSVDVLQKVKAKTVGKSRSVGVCLKNKSNRFWDVDMKEGMMSEIEGTDIQLLVDAPVTDSNPKEQNRILEELLDQDVDALIYTPVNPIANKKILNKFVERKIPIIIVDTEIELDIPNYFIGFDNYEGGKLVAQHLSEELKQRSHILVVEGLQNINAKARIDGFIDTIGNKHDLHKIKADYATSIAFERTLDFVRNHKVEAVFAASDNMAVGVIQALEKLGISIPVCGFDHTEQGKLLLENGKLLCDIDTHPEKLGSLAVQTVKALLKNKTVAERVLYDIELIT